MKKKLNPQITCIQPADENNQVVTIEGGGSAYRRKPCAKCPWRVDATGEFPAEAFRHSADTAYDMSMKAFGCHESGTQKTATCAGFLLRGAEHNLRVRLGLAFGTYADDISDNDLELHASYRDMAIANGVDPDDPIIAPCRANSE